MALRCLMDCTISLHAQDALLFVGVRGLANAVFFWPVLFIASAAGDDPFPKPGEHYAWGGLVLMAGISVVLTLLITLGASGFVLTREGLGCGGNGVLIPALNPRT